MKDCSKLYGLTNLNNKPNYYKNPVNLSCIDFILTNIYICPKCFQNTTVIETGLSNFHEMEVPIMQTNVCKLKLKIVY